MRSIEHLLRTIVCAFLLCVSIRYSLAQSTTGTPWKTDGNTATPNCFIGTTDSSALMMKTAGEERIEVTAEGDVVIKSLAGPTRAAVLASPSGALYRADDPGTDSLVSCGQLLWDGDGNAASPFCFIGTTNAEHFRMYSNNTERMRITADGRIGIHTLAPKAAFQFGDVYPVFMEDYLSGPSAFHRVISFNAYRAGGALQYHSAGPAAQIDFDPSAKHLQLSVAPAGQVTGTVSFPTALVIREDGHVGIGTFTAASPLTVVGGMRSQDPADADNFVRMRHSGSEGLLEVGTSASNNNAHDRLRITGADMILNQRLGIGTTDFTDATTSKEYRLSVNGRIRCMEVKVYSGWADYVFEPGYALMPLPDVKSYIQEYGHLPGVPSAQEVEENGVDVGETQAKLLEKVEELYLHVIRLEEENALLRSQMAEMNGTDTE